MRLSALLIGAALVTLVGCADRPAMTVEPDPVLASTAVWARFDRPISGRATDQYWIVIAPRDAAPDYGEGRVHVDRGAHGVHLVAPAEPGQYEVRLHGDWPRRQHNVVRVVPLVVLPNTAIVGAR